MNRKDVEASILALRAELEVREKIPTDFPASVDAEIKRAISNQEALKKQEGGAHLKCKHGRSPWDDCDVCITDYLQSALESAEHKE